MFIYRFLILSLTGVILAIMTDVKIDVSGNLSTPPTVENVGNTFQKFIHSVPSLSSFDKSCRESIRPWTQFANTSNFKTPPNAVRFFKRAVNNVKYFQGNYAIISIVLMAYCLLTSPLLLLSIIASLVACYMLTLRNAEKKMVIRGRDVPLAQQYSLVGLVSLPIYYWAGVGQAVFWVLGASCFVISIHAGLYNIDAILNEQDQLEILIQNI